MPSSDVIFPGLFYFPENREFPGIQSNFPGIPGNLLKATVFLIYRELLVKLLVLVLTLSLFSATFIPNECNILGWSHGAENT